MASSPKWIKVKNLDCSIRGIFSINSDEFAVLSIKHGYQRYNTFNDTSCSIDVLGNKLHFFDDLAFDKESQMLFVLEGSSVFTINIKTKRRASVQLLGCREKVSLRKGRLFHTGDDIHLFDECNDHWICNTFTVNKCMRLFCLKDTFSSGNKPTFKFSDCTIIHIPSKKCLLFIGAVGRSMQLWTLSMSSNKWKRIEDACWDSAEDFGAVLTSDEKYIIILGLMYVNVLDVSKDDESHWRFVHNLRLFKCPTSGKGKAVITGGAASKGDILVVGFIRNCFKERTIDLPPNEIVNIIIETFNGFNAEMVHWFCKGEHYTVYLKDILCFSKLPF